MSKLITFLTICFCTFNAWGYTAWQYSLPSRETIDQEILAAEVMNSYQLFGGSVRIVWQRNDIDEIARSLSAKIKKLGVLPEDIVMDKAITVQKAASLLTIAIEVNQAPYYCDYPHQNYKVKSEDKSGCALDNNLYMSLIDKSKVVF